MTGLSLCHVPHSPSFSVLWLLEEIGEPFDLEVPDGTRNLPLSEALHLRRVLPSLSDEGVRMHETGAMIEWLCETRAPGLWRAPGAEGRVGWLDWLHFAGTLITQVAAVLRGGDAATLHDALGVLEDRLDQSGWLLRGFSGVDCRMGHAVGVALDVVGAGSYPSLQAYQARCAGRPAFQRALTS